MGQVETLQSLLKTSEVMINAQNKHKQTLLHVATRQDRQAVVGLLLNLSPMYVSLADEDGNLPIHYAAAKASVTIMELLLLKDNVDQINANNKHKQTPLHLAAKELRHKTIEFLLHQPFIDVNVRDDDGNLTIHYTAEPDLPEKKLELSFRDPKVVDDWHQQLFENLNNIVISTKTMQ